MITFFAVIFLLKSVKLLDMETMTVYTLENDQIKPTVIEYFDVKIYDEYMLISLQNDMKLIVGLDSKIYVYGKTFDVITKVKASKLTTDDKIVLVTNDKIELVQIEDILTIRKKVILFKFHEQPILTYYGAIIQGFMKTPIRIQVNEHTDAKLDLLNLETANLQI